jgi:hypothetical protein
VLPCQAQHAVVRVQAGGGSQTPPAGSKDPPPPAPRPSLRFSFQPMGGAPLQGSGVGMDHSPGALPRAAVGRPTGAEANRIAGHALPKRKVIGPPSAGLRTAQRTCINTVEYQHR